MSRDAKRNTSQITSFFVNSRKKGPYPGTVGRLSYYTPVSAVDVAAAAAASVDSNRIWAAVAAVAFDSVNTESGTVVKRHSAAAAAVVVAAVVAVAVAYEVTVEFVSLDLDSSYPSLD